MGLARAALDAAVGHARERRQFGRPIADFQGLRFLLADMATQVEAGRALYLEAARLRDEGRPFGRCAAMAKLFCTDAAMRVTTDAVQVLGGYGYTADFPVERFLREAKMLQIVEGPIRSSGWSSPVTWSDQSPADPDGPVHPDGSRGEPGPLLVAVAGRARP